MVDLIEARVVVIGSGPAGIAAACAAAESGGRVLLVDGQSEPGGAIWRGAWTGRVPAADPAPVWFDRLRRAPVETAFDTTIVGRVGPHRLLAAREHRSIEIRYDRLILATGARELLLPFPGWTLPGVVGAGALQLLVKNGLPIAGARVAVVGSGPLLPAVAASLRARGASIAVLIEQASWRALARFAGHLMVGHFSKFRQALALKRAIRGTAYRAGCWPRAAVGEDRVRSIVFTDGVHLREEPCDWVACGFGLVPNLELAAMLGCGIRDGRLTVDDHQESTQEGVFGAGELCGVGGVDLALALGRIAGHASVGDRVRAERWMSLRDKHRRLATRLEHTFRLRSELERLCEPETIVCRCEDVPFGSLRGAASARDAKLATRCGMGPCQGRICGPATERLFGWTDRSGRPPLVPIRLDALADPPDS
ncbi:MAG: FAD-dependent oxidoreductase [Planctomycetes bacterium]|nr:FAD-dependent oxidoreductase [Planctomycetota bacterium]